MGQFLCVRIPESVLREMYDWLKDTGVRAPLWAEIGREAAAGGNTTYTLTLENDGHKGNCVAAEDITISLVLPAGSKVVGTTGTGYPGVRLNREAGADAAVWQVQKISAAERQTNTLTLSWSGATKDAFMGWTIRWAKPVLRRPPGQVLKDARSPDAGDFITTTGQAQLPTGQVRSVFVLPPDAP